MSVQQKKSQPVFDPRDPRHSVFGSSASTLSPHNPFDPRNFWRLHELKQSGRMGKEADATSYDESRVNEADNHLSAEQKERREEKEFIARRVSESAKAMSDDAFDKTFGASVTTTFASGRQVVETKKDGYTDVTINDANGNYLSGECRRPGAVSFAKQIEKSGADTAVSKVAAKPAEEPGLFDRFTSGVSGIAQKAKTSLMSAFSVEAVQEKREAARPAAERQPDYTAPPSSFDYVAA